ncbi:MAG: hypothetical protein JSV27_00175 [Candidatus Bathyarchaeota archaeon]|nr:MAG: hypothetical protein JSV27_00175 [Candidatus Bathyarchaeota archaeon]
MYPSGNCHALLPREKGIEPGLVAPISSPAPIILLSPPWFKDIRYYGEFYIVTEFAQEPLNDQERELIRAQRSWEETKSSD